MHLKRVRSESRSWLIPDWETPIFLAILVPTGLLVYCGLLEELMSIRSVGGGSNPFVKMLNHAYFFDDAYYAFAKGFSQVF